ncbi:MAG: ATP-binding protein [Pirellulales bacterium]
MLDSFAHLFSSHGFPARWNCGPAWKQEPWWGWIHIGSDLVIWLCYFAIPVILLGIARKKKDLPFPTLVVLFALFILACGGTHLADAIVFYVPIYRASGLLKLFTAIISMSTVIALYFIIPKALQLRGPKEAEREIQHQTQALQNLTSQLSNEIEAHRGTLSELQRNRELLHLAMSAGDIGFFHWNLESDALEMDEALIRLLGFQTISVDHLSPSLFFEHVHPEDRENLKSEVDDCVQTCKNYNARFRYQRPDGTSVWLSGRGLVLRNSRGEPSTFIGFNQDISHQVEREAKLDELAKQAISASEHKSRFIAQVSHEIRTPLTAMLGGLDALLMECEPGGTRDAIRIVRSQGELLQILVNDVLDLSKIEAGHLHIQTAPIDVANLIADVCSLMDPLAVEKGLVIRWFSESQLPATIQSDGYRLKQVFVNLIGNAIKFTDEGEIVVRVRLDATVPLESFLVVEVEDSGRGIPQDKLGEIFEEYTQASADPSGSGLGLAICKKLLQLMNGTLLVRSEEGKGSTFEIRIPLGDIRQYTLEKVNPITRAESVKEHGIAQLSPMALRVLAAEDTRAIQFVLRRMLEPYVLELVIVPNGRVAIETVLGRGVDSFDVILMDIQMPEIDGTEATLELRKRGYTRPIIALTAGAMESERKACMAAGCTHFLAKPIDVQDLKRVLESIASNDNQGNPSF